MKRIIFWGTILGILVCMFSYSNAADFYSCELGSETRQYDSTRFPFSADSIWYNGSQNWFMIAFAVTIGNEPLYPVYLDHPVYTDSDVTPYMLVSMPNYLPDAGFSSMAFFDFAGFEDPIAWEGEEYDFFIDANVNGVLDSGETSLRWEIQPETIRPMDLPLVRISGGANPTISWDPVPDAVKYMVNFYRITDDGFGDMDVRIYSSGLITETSFTYNGDIFEGGDEYAVWVQAREIIPDTLGLFYNRSGCFTTHQAVDIDDVLDFFENQSGSGGVVGMGPGNSSVHRLDAFERMLLRTGSLIEQNDLDGACQLLVDVYNKCDGKSNPDDFVGGDAVFQLSKLILHLMTNLECE